MRLSDLQNKNIVSITDGRNIGNIIDVKIDEVNGSIISLIIEASKNFFSFSNKSITQILIFVKCLPFFSIFCLMHDTLNVSLVERTSRSALQKERK